MRTRRVKLTVSELPESDQMTKPAIYITFILMALALPDAHAESIYVQAVPEMAVYEIGPIQIDASDRHDPQVVAQWRMVRAGAGPPSVHAITGERGLILLFAGVSGKRSGTLRFDYEGSTQKPASVAIWFERSRPRLATCLVSNISTLGVVDPKRLPKLVGIQEAADFAAERERRLPPRVAPDGFQFLLRSHRIVPGMPIKAAWEGQWYDAEVLAIDARGWLSVLYADKQQTMRLLPSMPQSDSSWFAVNAKTLSAARRASRFRPSLNVLPGTTSVIPTGFVPLPEIRVPPGLPVKYSFATSWLDGIVIRANAQQAEVRTEHAGPAQMQTIPRSKLLVTEADAKRAAGRTAIRHYAGNVNTPEQK